MALYLPTFLSNWQWPQIDGLHSFKGDLLHSASWDNNVDLKGKKVAVIGNGSSGIQLVTAIQPAAAHLTTFIRSPTWIATTLGQDFAGPNGANFDCTFFWKRQPITGSR
jgi:cation diffusion facilitator CzcD-associated flavoprotein CzcO